MLDRDYEVEGFISSTLHRNTEFTIKTVYQYDTYPSWRILELDDNNDDFYKVQFGVIMHRLAEAIRYELRKVNLMDNKIGVELKWRTPGFRDGQIGTIYYCYKDGKHSLCFGCAPSKYVKHDLDIKFHI